MIGRMEGWQRYAWLDEDDSDVVMAACLGVALGAPLETVLRAFALEKDQGTMTLADAWMQSESDFGNGVVRVEVGDSWVRHG
jgi:hypothetical protein